MRRWEILYRDLSEAGRPILLAGAICLMGPRGEAQAADVAIGADGRIASVARAEARWSGLRRVDIGGLTLSPALIDAHQHLDKTGALKFAPNPSGTLQGAREAFAAFARRATPQDVAQRASRTLARCLERGTTALRSHINVDKDAGFVGLEVMSSLRAAWADRMSVQLVAFIIPHPGQDYDWLDANIDAAARQADALGGTVAVAEDPARYLDAIFTAAVRHGKPIDLHMDEHLDAQRQRFDLVFDRVKRFGMQGRVVLSHASVLSAVANETFARIRDEILALDLGVITLPAANLYIQGRGQEILPPRGLTRVAALARAGARIAAASDNIQDPFIPTGSGDMLEIARWTLLAGHLHAVELPLAFQMATSAPAALMGLAEEHGIREGARADLILCDSSDVEALVGGGPDNMIVLSRGRPVAATLRSKSDAAAQTNPGRVLTLG